LTFPVRRWISLGIGAAAVAAAIAIVYLALFAPIGEPHRRSARAERRRAQPGAARLRTDTRLERRSRVHVVVHAHGLMMTGDAGTSTTRDLEVMLDTALSLPITTPRGERLFGLRPGLGEVVESRAFSGTKTELLPADDAQRLTVSIASTSDPLRVPVPVRYLGVNEIADADAVLPPHLLAPEGGFVAIDPANQRLSTCETSAACMSGTGFTRISEDAACPKSPGLIVVAARIEGSAARLLLDTGGASWISRSYFDAHALSTRATAFQDGKLMGAGASVTDGRVAQGRFLFAFGRDASATRTAERLWVIAAPGGPVTDCGLDGSIGLDVLGDCELVLGDGTPPSAFARCRATDTEDPSRRYSGSRLN